MSDAKEALIAARDELRAAARARWKRISQWVLLGVGILAVIVGVYFLWRGVVVAATVTDLLWELAIVVAGGIAAMIGIVLLLEGRTRVQQVVMPGADENHSLLDWIGRIVRSRSERRKPLLDISPQLVKVEADPVAIAVLAGLGAIGSSVRALGRYLLMAILFLAIAWSLAPFAASLAP